MIKKIKKEWGIATNERKMEIIESIFRILTALAVIGFIISIVIKRGYF